MKKATLLLCLCSLLGLWARAQDLGESYTPENKRFKKALSFNVKTFGSNGPNFFGFQYDMRFVRGLNY